MRVLKKLALSFTLAASMIGAVPTENTSAFVLPMPENKPGGWNAMTDTAATPLTEHKNFQDSFCQEFKHASSNEYARKLTHNCLLTPGNKEGAGLSINVDEDKIGQRYIVTPSLGFGFRFNTPAF